MRVLPGIFSEYHQLHRNANGMLNAGRGANPRFAAEHYGSAALLLRA
jgi:hypothetical protein